MGSGTRQVDAIKPIFALKSAVPSSAAPQWVAMNNYGHITIFILQTNATTVTGSAITLKQAVDVSGTSSKTLAFKTYWSNTDVSANDTLTVQTASSNTFTTDATNSKNSIYVIEVDATDLDVANAFNYIQVGVGNGTANTIAVLYTLSITRQGGNYAIFPSAVV